MKPLKVKLNRLEVTAMYNMLFLDAIDTDWEGVGNILVQEILAEIYRSLQKMLNNPEQKKFTLKLSPVQQIGAVLYSPTVNPIVQPYEAMLMRKIVEQIDRSIV